MGDRPEADRNQQRRDMSSQDSLIAKVMMPAESVGYGEKCRAVSALAQYLPSGAVIDAYRDILLREDDVLGVISLDPSEP